MCLLPRWFSVAYVRKPCTVERLACCCAGAVAVPTTCHVQGEAGVVSTHGKMVLLCWCKVFDAVPRLV